MPYKPDAWSANQSLNRRIADATTLQTADSPTLKLRDGQGTTKSGLQQSHSPRRFVQVKQRVNAEVHVEDSRLL